MKVAHDAENVYFHARTRQALTPSSEPNWMWLLIDVDADSKTGWEGYDFIVNRKVDGDGTAWLEKNDGGWRRKPVARVLYRADRNDLHLAVPRQSLGIPRDPAALSFDFRWADNLQQPGDVMDFSTSGDVAPEGRFRFRYLAE